MSTSASSGGTTKKDIDDMFTKQTVGLKSYWDSEKQMLEDKIRQLSGEQNESLSEHELMLASTFFADELTQTFVDASLTTLTSELRAASRPSLVKHAATLGLEAPKRDESKEDITTNLIAKLRAMAAKGASKKAAATPKK